MREVGANLGGSNIAGPASAAPASAAAAVEMKEAFDTGSAVATSELFKSRYARTLSALLVAAPEGEVHTCPGRLSVTCVAGKVIAPAPTT
jgi:hypothetical protein